MRSRSRLGRVMTLAALVVSLTSCAASMGGSMHTMTEAEAAQRAEQHIAALVSADMESSPVTVS